MVGLELDKQQTSWVCMCGTAFLCLRCSSLQLCVNREAAGIIV